ncbi:hypothetical protein AB0395_46185 [Streptosporangium sp. NPDC051023]|uniref:hypothetical protein n=1 Tax=Streptosporangium sp. NPDC051023 TaxID=3155410 RepID=UPI00344CDA50
MTSPRVLVLQGEAQFWQAVMVLRWFRGEGDIPKLGRDHRVSRATAAVTRMNTPSAATG